ncbi:MAG: flagellar protein FliS [Fibrobacteres bacterium]|nr:flagellar protein FliS [Fibrobacterota bacterium]
MPKKEKIEEFINTALGSSGTMASIILLIDKAIILIKEIREKPEAQNENSRRVRNILAQLQMALNYSEGKDTESLFTLYDYLFQEMQIGDAHSLDSAQKLLTQLRSTFKELKKRIISESR